MKKSFLKIEHKNLYLLYRPKDKHYNIRVYYLQDENGLFHHDSLPALIIIEKSGFRRECYFTHGILHRSFGAAETVHYPKIDTYDGSRSYTVISTYHEKKSLAKGKEPLGIKKIYGNKSLLELYQSPFRNSPSSYSYGPAYILTSPINRVHIYEKDGKHHREDGPAFMEWNHKEELVESEWFLEGESVDGNYFV